MNDDSSSPRIFLGLIEIAGFYSVLAEGFRENGVAATLGVIGDHRFEYSSRSRHPLVRWVGHALNRRITAPRWNLLARVCWTIEHQVSKLVLLLWATARHDVFIFSYASTFFNYYELPFLKALGKRIIYVFHGSDSRPLYLNGARLKGESPPNVQEVVRQTERMKWRIDRIGYWADEVLSDPLHSHFHNGSRILRSLVGRIAQVDIEEGQSGAEKPQTPPYQRNTIRILHAPSHRGGKGTQYIRAVVEALEGDNYSIDYVEVSDEPHSVVERELARCDIVIDQVFSDAPVSTFALEAAYYGRPVLMAGYSEPHWSPFFPESKRLPIAFCEPEDLKEELEHLLQDRKWRSELGAKAQAFARRCCTPSEVAKNYIKVVSGDIPTHWVYNPVDIRYTHGFGLTKAEARESIHKVLQVSGVEGLGLDDKPELQRIMVEFAESGVNPVRT